MRVEDGTSDYAANQARVGLPRYVPGMPQFLKPDQFTMSIDDGTPTLELHDATVSSTEGWSFLNRTTLLVADGPGEEGFLLPRRTGSGEDLAPERWDETVASTGTVRLVAPGTRIIASVIE